MRKIEEGKRKEALKGVKSLFESINNDEIVGEIFNEIKINMGETVHLKLGLLWDPNTELHKTVKEKIKNLINTHLEKLETMKTLDKNTKNIILDFTAHLVIKEFVKVAKMRIIENAKLTAEDFSNHIKKEFSKYIEIFEKI